MFERLTLVTAPATPALTLAEVKAHCRVDFDDDDALLSALIDAATGAIDGPDGIGFAMVAQTWKLTLDCFPAKIRLPLRPAVSVSAIRYQNAADATQTLDASAYRVSIAGGIATITPAVGTAWPGVLSAPGSVEVEFVAGEGVPALLKSALLLMVGDWYENREAQTDRPLSPNPAVEAILSRYRAGQVTA